MLLKSLVIIGATLGIVVGSIGTAVPWLFPGIFTHDKVVISQVFLFPFSYMFPATHLQEGRVSKQFVPLHIVTDAQGHHTIFPCFIHHTEYPQSRRHLTGKLDLCLSFIISL